MSNPSTRTHLDTGEMMPRGYVITNVPADRIRFRLAAGGLMVAYDRTCPKCRNNYEAHGAHELHDITLNGRVVRTYDVTILEQLVGERQRTQPDQRIVMAHWPFHLEHTKHTPPGSACPSDGCLLWRTKRGLVERHLRHLGPHILPETLGVAVYVPLAGNSAHQVALVLIIGHHRAEVLRRAGKPFDVMTFTEPEIAPAVIVPGQDVVVHDGAYRQTVSDFVRDRAGLGEDDWPPLGPNEP